jgi:preprotein translocase subunit SecA
LFGHSPVSITADAHSRLKVEEVTRKLFEEYAKMYRSKLEEMAAGTLPVFKMIRENEGDRVENVVVPLTDGKRQMQIPVPIIKAIETEGREVMKVVEKNTVLGLIDTAWKEHLREMDDLKQSVQNAVFEQKDPLLVYKFEALGLFRQLIARINEEVLTFLYKAIIPVEEAEPEARGQRRQQRRPVATQTSRQEVGEPQTTEEEENTPRRIQPVRQQKIANRNDRVTVRYANGEIKKDVKYKTVEEDIVANKCVVVDIS